MSIRHGFTPPLLALTLLAGCKATTVHLYTLAPAPTAFATVEAADTHESFVIDAVRKGQVEMDVGESLG